MAEPSSRLLRMSALFEEQQRVFEKIARDGSVDEALSALCTLAERACGGEPHAAIFRVSRERRLGRCVGRGSPSPLRATLDDLPLAEAVTSRWPGVSVWPIKPPAGEALGVFALLAVPARELSEEERVIIDALVRTASLALEREHEPRAMLTDRARLAYAVRLSGIGFWYCDLPFDELIWDVRVKAHFFLAADARVTIDTFYERIVPDDRERTRTAIEASIRDHTLYDIVYRTHDPASGAMKWIRALGGTSYGTDGSPTRFDGVTVDVSQLEGARVELERARFEAEEANRAKDEFLAMLGHELRNPLAPIQTALQLMSLSAGLSHERGRVMIERQVKHLVRLVDDLLDVSRITRGKVELVRAHVELADVTARAIEMASPLLEQRHHQLIVGVERGLVVDGDPDRLSQIVSNLITNAAKYTPDRGRITITASSVGADVALTVEDTGIGIPADLLPRIFDLFVQGRQGIERTQGGLGLGLAIVRRLAEMHGGRVSASSEGTGKGATFTLHLPRVVALEAVGASPTSPSASTFASAARPQRILIVDDNEDAAELLGEALAAMGHTTRVAYDGPSGLDAAKDFQPVSALVDIGLPVMDGYEVARRFRQDPSLRHVRLVAVTGYGQLSDRKRAQDAGFDDHLVKPVDLDRLLELLDSATSLR